WGESLARTGDTATRCGDACQGGIQRGRRIQIDQGAARSWRRRGRAGDQGSAYTFTFVGKYGALGRPHGLAAHFAAQYGLVKSLGLVELGAGDFEPADSVFHEGLLLR